MQQTQTTQTTYHSDEVQYSWIKGVFFYRIEIPRVSYTREDIAPHYILQMKSSSCQDTLAKSKSVIIKPCIA